MGLARCSLRNHDNSMSSKNDVSSAKRTSQSSLDFPTKLALILSAVTVSGLLLMLLTSVAVLRRNSNPSVNVHQEHRSYLNYHTPPDRWLEAVGTDYTSNNNSNITVEDYSAYSCSHLYELIPDAGHAQCAFAETCNQGEGVWAPFVFCSAKYSRTFLCAMLSPLMLLWLVLLFRMLASTAEDYFSPALEMFSFKLGLPPHLAGVTLLAMGNSAADVSATVSAITSDPVAGYKLCLGALSGAAMLSSGVVSALVILAAPDAVPCSGALIRDVAALSLAVAAVWHQLRSGTIRPHSIALFLGLYIAFVLLVLAADLYHHWAVILPRRLAVAVPADDDSSPLPSSDEESVDEFVAVSSNDTMEKGDEEVGADWNLDSIDLAKDRHDQPMHQRHTEVGRIVESPSRAKSTPSSVEQDPDNVYTVLDSTTVIDESVLKEIIRGPADSWFEALSGGLVELWHHAATIWCDIMYGEDIHPVSRFLLVCELPFTLVRQLTVPVPCGDYYCRAQIAFSLAVSPFWFVYYLWDEHGVNMLAGDRWPYLLTFELAVVASALCILRFAPGGKGEMRLAYSTPIALYGFIIAATWIDTVADALVSLLTFIGIIFRIPGPVVGLTILAWGNTVSDLTANLVLARRGLVNMALTACFAEPVFNILVGLGLGFTRLAVETGKAETNVSLSSSVVTGFVCIAFNAVALLGTGLSFGKGSIPKEFGHLALAIYGIYLVTSISLQYAIRW